MGEGQRKRQPIDELLTDAAGALRAVDVTDTAGVSGAAWHGFCVTRAAGVLLSHPC